MEAGVDELVDNTTVIAVNTSELAGETSGGLLRPEPAPVTRTNSNRSANETKVTSVK